MASTEALATRRVAGERRPRPGRPRVRQHAGQRPPGSHRAADGRVPGWSSRAPRDEARGAGLGRDEDRGSARRGPGRSGRRRPPRRAARAAGRAAAARTAASAPGPSTRTSVGAVDAPRRSPPRRPRAFDVSPPVRPSPSSRSRSGEAATASPPAKTTTVSPATARSVRRRRRAAPSAAGRRPPRRRASRRRARRPSAEDREQRGQQGDRDTTTPTTAVRARRAKARKKSTSPTSSVAVPRAVISPAVIAMATMWALAPTAAWRASLPRASREADAEQVEDRVVGVDDADEERGDHRLDVLAGGDAGGSTAPMAWMSTR